MKPLPLPLPIEVPVAAPPSASVLRPVTAPTSHPQPSGRRRAVWLGIHLPHWPLHASLSVLDERERARLEKQPLAVVDADRRATIIALNEAASSLGVRWGHSLNAAIALSADMQFLPRAPDREVELLRDIATVCEQYTSTVSLQPPNELLLEIRGSMRLFGGLTALLERVKLDFHRLGFSPQIAVSATAQSTLWIARSSCTAKVVRPRELIASISQLPLSSLQWPVDVELRLVRFGVTRIGDLLRLPRGGLARRIGYQYLAELDRAVGRQPEVRRHFKSPESYEDVCALEFEIETTALLARLIEKRLDRLRRFLVRRDLSLDHLRIDLHHREHENTPISLGLARPTMDMSHVARLMQEHVARLQLPAPVRAFTVRVQRLVPAQPGTQELFPKTTSADAIAAKVQAQARLLEQVRSRLGEASIVQLCNQTDHRPERAHTEQPCRPEPHVIPSAMPVDLAPRPLWLLREPRHIRIGAAQAKQLDGCRPEKIESGWWDGQLAIRDYYYLPSPHGALAWLYRDHTRGGKWCLHGWFG